jgi:toxin ParE1/3/4
MPEIIWTAAAKTDVEEIWRYIAAHDSPDRADRVAEALDLTVARLADSPNLGNRPKELLALGIMEYRELHWKPYRIMYAVEGRRVVIYCVLDGRRDMKTLLQQRLLR